MGGLYLAGAIVFEVFGTISLRMASTGKKNWFVGVGIGYLIAFGMLVLTLSTGMALGVAYGIWVAAGVALTVVLSKFLFKEPFTLIMGVGIALIGVGVLLIEIGAAH
jgi:small multidrug resistance pump